MNILIKNGEGGWPKLGQQCTWKDQQLAPCRTPLLSCLLQHKNCNISGTPALSLADTINFQNWSLAVCELLCVSVFFPCTFLT